MATYYTSTAECKCPVIISWTCSQCGTKCFSKQTIKGQGQQQFFGGTKERRNSIAEMTSNAAYYSVARTIQAINLRDSNTMSTIYFDACCSNCNHREYWAKKRLDPMTIASPLVKILIILLIISVFCFCMKEWIAGAVIIGSCLLIAGGFILFCKYSIDKSSEREQKTPIHSFPKIELPENSEQVQ